MFRKKVQELELPPVARENPRAVEVLRVWAVPGEPQELVLKTTWKDPGAWGLVLVDIARHASKAYANEGRDQSEVIARIRQSFEAEFSNPTDEPVQLS